MAGDANERDLGDEFKTVSTTGTQTRQGPEGGDHASLGCRSRGDRPQSSLTVRAWVPSTGPCGLSLLLPPQARFPTVGPFIGRPVHLVDHSIPIGRDMGAGRGHLCQRSREWHFNICALLVRSRNERRLARPCVVHL